MYASFRTVRETRPDTVEFRHADAIRKSSRVPNVRTLCPGSASTARSSENTGPPAAATTDSAAVSSLAIAPFPVQPSTNTTDDGS